MALLDSSNNGDLVNVIDSIKKGADLEFLGPDWKRALQQAAENGHLEIVQYLVENGANLEAAHDSSMNMTALQYAAYNNQVSLIQSIV